MALKDMPSWLGAAGTVAGIAAAPFTGGASLLPSLISGGTSLSGTGLGAYGAYQQGQENSTLTQQELAQKASLSFNAITKIEQGAVKHPTLKTLLKLTEAFGIGLDELVGRK